MSNYLYLLSVCVKTELLDVFRYLALAPQLKCSQLFFLLNHSYQINCSCMCVNYYSVIVVLICTCVELVLPVVQQLVERDVFDDKCPLVNAAV